MWPVDFAVESEVSFKEHSRVTSGVIKLIQFYGKISDCERSFGLFPFYKMMHFE